MKHDRRFSIRTPLSSSDQSETACELSTADALFARLDGQWIGRAGRFGRGGGSGEAWRAEVVAIHMSGGKEAWVQIGPARQPEKAVVVRLPDATQAQIALDALEAWSALPEDARPRVIDLSDCRGGE